MKNRNTALIIAMIMVLTGICGCSSGQKAERYIYPFTPDSPEWLECETLDDMIALCQIPEDKLKAMDAATLVQAALDYPLFINAFAFNSMTQGMDSIFSYANVLQELERRSDAGPALLRIYQSEKVLTDADWEQTALDDRFRIYYMEALLARESIYSQLSGSELIQLDEAVAEKHREKRKYPNLYGISSDIFYDLLAEAQGIGEGMGVWIADKYTITMPSGAVVEVDKTRPTEATEQPEEGQ